MKKIFLVLIMPFIIEGCKQSNSKADEEANTQIIGAFSEKSKKVALELIESYRQRAIKGESMSDLASKYSEDPGSAKNGGRYDDITKGVMVPEFEKVVFNLKPGEISGVFETQYGYHFAQLIERHGEMIDVRHLLVIPK